MGFSFLGGVTPSTEYPLHHEAVIGSHCASVNLASKIFEVDEILADVLVKDKILITGNWLTLAQNRKSSARGFGFLVRVCRRPTKSSIHHELESSISH